MQGKTVIVTGATGFVGCALCERLLSEGARVRGVGRNAERGQVLTAKGGECIEADTTDHPASLAPRSQAARARPEWRAKRESSHRREP